MPIVEPAERRGDRDGELAEGTLRLAEEVAHAAKREVVTGRVDVHTVTDTVDETVRATVQGQTVTVTRVPIECTVDAAPAVRTEGDVTIVPVLEEVLVIEKRLLLKEEVHITWTTRSDDIETTVPLRRQRAIVERHEAGSLPNASDPHSKDNQP